MASRRELADAGQLGWELWCIDGSHVRAHRVAGYAGSAPSAGVYAALVTRLRELTWIGIGLG